MTAVAAHVVAPSRVRASRGRRLTLLLLSGLVLGFAAFALPHFLPPQPYGLADDYRVFYAASRVAAAGGNPYDTATIHAAEQAADFYPHVQPSLDDFVNLPLVAWVMRPLTALPFWASYAAFTTVGAALIAWSILSLARQTGWRRPGPLVLLAGLSWISLLSLLSGQFDAVLLGGLAFALALAARGRAGLAGAVCAVAWIKPDLAWPVVPFLALALWPDRRAALRLLAVFAGVSAALLALQSLLLPGLLAAWWHHLTVFAGRVDTVQPDLAGLPALLHALPGGGGGVLGWRSGSLVGAGVAAAAVAGVAMCRSAAWRALPAGARLTWGVGLPLALWLLVTPYGHPNDDVLLLPALLLVLGRDGLRLEGPGLLWAVLAVAVLPLAWPLHLLPGATAPAILLAVLAGTVLGRRTPGLRGLGPGAAVLALALLPAVWPFHVLDVGLTPIAVLVLCAEASVAAAAPGAGQPGAEGRRAAAAIL